MTLYSRVNGTEPVWPKWLKRTKCGAWRYALFDHGAPSFLPDAIVEKIITAALAERKGLTLEEMVEEYKRERA